MLFRYRSRNTETQSRSSDVAYRICGIAAPWHYGPVALRPVPADVHSDRNAGANGPLGRVAQCRRLVVYRDGVHRGSAGRRKSGAGGWRGTV